MVSNHYTNVNLFADDVLLYHLITDAMDYAVLQEAIRLLEDWSITNQLNVSKSVVSPWRPFAKGGVLKMPGLTHFKQHVMVNAYHCNLF